MHSMWFYYILKNIYLYIYILVNIITFNGFILYKVYIYILIATKTNFSWHRQPILQYILFIANSLFLYGNIIYIKTLSTSSSKFFIQNNKFFKIIDKSIRNKFLVVTRHEWTSQYDALFDNSSLNSIKKVANDHEFFVCF